MTLAGEPAAASSPTDRGPTIRLLLFSVDGQRYALRLDGIERVIRAVELNALPGSPPVIRGVFSLHGRIVPVADLRRRLGLPEKEIGLNDWIVIARTASRVLGMLIEGDTDLSDCAARDIVGTETMLCTSQVIEGIVRLPDGLVLIQNLAKFLSIAEESSLAEALK